MLLNLIYYSKYKWNKKIQIYWLLLIIYKFDKSKLKIITKVTVELPKTSKYSVDNTIYEPNFRLDSLNKR